MSSQFPPPLSSLGGSGVSVSLPSATTSALSPFQSSSTPFIQPLISSEADYFYPTVCGITSYPYSSSQPVSVSAPMAYVSSGGMGSYYQAPVMSSTGSPYYQQHSLDSHQSLTSVSQQSSVGDQSKGMFEKAAGPLLGVGNLLAEHVIAHPCIVLRRQCQVHRNSCQYHMTPFTLMPVAFNIQQNQSILCFWKGVTSSGVIHGLTYVVERILSDFAGLPLDVSKNSTLRRVCKHFMLKILSYTLTTPFAAAAFVETVQSDVASERPGALECVKQGLSRLSLDFLGPKDNSKRLAVWWLVGPSVAYRFSHYFLSSLTYYIMDATVRKHLQRKSDRERTLFDQFYPELFAVFSSHLLADAILFPIETVLNRLFLQGTRTIIDNLDNGHSVIPIGSRYSGVANCVSSIITQEGWLGLYKGFGALVLQYSLHYAVLRTTKVIFDHLEESQRRRDAKIMASPRSTAAAAPYASHGLNVLEEQDISRFHPSSMHMAAAGEHAWSAM